MSMAIPITSDIPGKIKKMQNGNVFSSDLAFISETIQNSYRAKATSMKFLVTDTRIEIWDDGVGCKDPANITTFDFSAWDSTTEGFGMGIWSILSITTLTMVTIESHDWLITMDIPSLQETPIATISKQPRIPGFKITLTGIFDTEKTITHIEKIARFQPFQVFINHNPVTQIKLFDTLQDLVFSMDFNTKFFTARIGILDLNSPRYTFDIYYEKRHVTTDYISGCNGIIELKPGTLTLREPDRTQITHDDKYYNYQSTLTSCIVTLFKEFVKVATPAQLETYASYIASKLNAKDYIKYLDYSIDNIINETIITNLIVTRPEYDNPESYNDAPKKLAKHIITSNPDTDTRTTPPDPDTTFKFNELLKKHPYAFWVKASELDNYKHDIAKAHYYNILVFTATDRLYENAFIFKGIPHISDLNDHLVIETTIKNDYCKTEKEKTFLEHTLLPIATHFHIDPSKFVIADLTSKSCFKNNTKTSRKRINKIEGLVYNNKIYLDRKTINLKDFNLIRSNYATPHIKAVLATSPILAHEIAHLVFGTKDNTLEHYITQTYIQEQIGNIFRSK